MKVAPNIIICLQKKIHIFLRPLISLIEFLLISALIGNLFQKNVNLLFLNGPDPSTRPDLPARYPQPASHYNPTCRSLSLSLSLSLSAGPTCRAPLSLNFPHRAPPLLWLHCSPAKFTCSTTTFAPRWLLPLAPWLCQAWGTFLQLLHPLPRWRRLPWYCHRYWPPWCPRQMPSQQGMQHGAACNLPCVSLHGTKPSHRVHVGRLHRCHLAQLLHLMVVSVPHLAWTPASRQDAQHLIVYLVYCWWVWGVGYGYVQDYNIIMLFIIAYLWRWHGSTFCLLMLILVCRCKHSTWLKKLKWLN
jgi:hypothetical protein